MTALERNLRRGMSGGDVRWMKERLFQLGWYAPRITVIAKDSFGTDTLRAVQAFQRHAGLAPDGIVGPLTYAALLQATGDPTEPAEAVSQAPNLPGHIGPTAASAIGVALSQESGIRRNMVLDALGFAFDPTVGRDYPLSLYIRGGNLYNTDLTPNVITLARIASGAKRQPQYYDGGRREMMESAVRSDPDITGADCSGGVVGLLRHAGVVKPGFDLSADGFSKSGSYRHIEKTALRPGDLLHKSGHVGLFAGGGYAVEWMGGAYGCQLTKVSGRRGYSFVTGKTARMGAWTAFLRPAYY